MVQCKAVLLKPKSAKAVSWTFIMVPHSASAKMTSRGQISIEGTINGFGFAGVLEPDGTGSHWMKVEKKTREGAGAKAGDVVTLAFARAKVDLEPKVPADLRKALAAAPKAHAVWKDITSAARRDWIYWLDSAKRAETRTKRIDGACDMLAGGKRRVCCFDRSGIVGKTVSPPVPEE